MVRKVMASLAAVGTSLAVAACGGGTKTVTTQVTTTMAAAPAASLAQECPKGQSFMGCTQTGLAAKQYRLEQKLQKRAPKLFALPSGALFPDVSNWQGSVGWSSVKAWQQSHGWPTGGAFKMGEGSSRDTWAAHNASLLHSLHMWASGYWFVRNIGCSAEARAIIQAAHDYGVTMVDEDLEVPEARGYGVCLTPALKKAGLQVSEYTSPGSNPGGIDTSAGSWIATFGSSFRSIWQPVLAWQFTDGHFGSPVNVPGIGFDDVNVDYGFSKLAGPQKPPDPFAVLDKTVRVFGKVHASEFKTATTWSKSKCRVPVHRNVCVYSLAHLQLLTGRLWYVAHHKFVGGHWVTLKTADWSNGKGARFRIMWNEEHQTK